VWKAGCKTNFTEGVVERRYAADVFHEQDGSTTRYEDVFYVRSDKGKSKFADGGDSGAVICDGNGLVVGLLIAVGEDTDGYFTICRPTDQVWAAVNL